MGMWAQIEELKSANKRLGAEVNRLRGERLQAYLAMRHVRIADGHEAEGAMAALWRAAKVAEWVERESGTDYLFCPVCGESRLYGHASDCALDAALARFEVNTDAEPAA